MPLSAPEFLDVTARIRIPMREIHIVFTRSSGPGGQHVNKTSTQAELTFDLAHSASFSEEDRSWLLTHLTSKLDSEGILHINSQEFRSQLRNKMAAIERLRIMIANALVRPKTRKQVKPSRASREKRLQAKKIAGERKRQRAAQFEP